MMNFNDVCATQGDDVVITFTVRDKNDNLVDVSSAIATFRVSRAPTLTAVLELNNDSGITFSGSQVTVAFNTSDIEVSDFLCGEDFGIFDCQLRLTLAGKSMVSATGQLRLRPLIEA